MKYKNLKLRVILPSILIVIIALMVVAFFTGGLEAGALTKNNIEWSEDGFVTPDFQIEDGNVKWYLGTDSDGKKVPINTRKLVAEKGNYRMYLNEDTTIVSIVEYLGKDDQGNDIERELYTTANESGSAIDEKSNLTIYYYDANGKLSTGFNSFDKSVNYENKVQGRNEKKYSIRYNENGSLDILYQIGEFANILEVIPKYYNKGDFENVFIGNTFFNYTTSSSYEDVEVVGESGNTTGKQIKVEAKKGVFGYCLDNEAALYILKNGLATIEYDYRDYTAKPKDDDSPLKFDTVPEDESLILDKVGGVWQLNAILDENGNFNFNFKLGENCNSSNSPVKVNPFINASIISNSIFSPNFYPAKLDTVNDKDEKEIKDLQWYNRLNQEDGYHQFYAKTTLTSQELYKYLVVGQYSYLNTDQEIYSYLQDNSNEINAGKLKVLNSNYQQVDGVDVYFDYNGDGVITEDERYAVGGYQGRDLQDNYLYIDENNYVFYFDANGNRVINDENGVAKPVNSTGAYRPYNSGLSKEMVEEQNNKYNVGSEASSVAFQIALRFELTETGIEINVINDSIEEGKGKENTDPSVPSYLKHDSKLAKIEVCKYLTTNDDSNSVGSIIIPDGSGAVISFNSIKDKQFVGKYNEKFIYGDDTAINRNEAGNSIQDIMLPMYAFIEDGVLEAGKTSRGLAAVAIVEKGAAQTTITADFKRSSTTSGISNYNNAYFTTYFRSSESVQITSSSKYLKISDKLYDGDIKYVYRFITAESLNKDGSPINYVDIANNYREYLIAYYGLENKQDTTTTAVPTITFVGAYEKKNIKLGVVYDKEYSLTTFEEAGKIVDELTTKGLTSMNVTYTLWTDDEKYNKISDEYKISSVLGGKSGLEDLTEKLNQYQYNFFLDYTVTTGFGYDYSFGALKFNAKSISGSQSNALTYVLSTGLADAQGKVGGRLSPVFYNSLVSKYMKNFGKLNVNGINIKDLGNKNTSDYSKDRTVYSADGLEYQVESLKTAYETGKKVMLNTPYDYAFKYLDVANNVPVETTLYPIVDYSIPFYQLVVSGLFDYSSPTINSGNDYSVEWNLLKAIETGSNISFEVSASDTINLLDTEYTSYYNSYFSNWEDKILAMNDKLNKSGIYESRLVNHEFITDTLVQVTYENGLTILINYSNNNASIGSYTVRANSFAVVQTGKGA